MALDSRTSMQLSGVKWMPLLVTFDSVKLDGCGRYLDMNLYATTLNTSGRSVLIENCHWGSCDKSERQACPAIS